MKRIFKLLALALVVLSAAPLFASPPLQSSNIASLTAGPTVRHVDQELLLAVIVAEVPTAAGEEFAELIDYGNEIEASTTAASVPGARRPSQVAHIVDPEVIVDTGQIGTEVDSEYHRAEPSGGRPSLRHPPARAVQG